MLDIKDLKEQDLNAQVMAPQKFERLTENIRHRGALESLPYCWRPGDEGDIEIISGHHRMRAARAAGIETIPCLVDVSHMTRSEAVAKQLAHNALVGHDDREILKQLTSFLDTPDDRLFSGLPDDAFADKDDVDTMRLFTPRVDFDFRTVSFAFLPHQQAELEKLLDMLDGRQDLVVAAPVAQFEELLKVAARFARIRDIRAGSTAITLMVRLALEEIEEWEQAQEEEAVASSD